MEDIQNLKRHIGHFSIHTSLLFSDFKGTSKLFENIIILRAEYRFDKESIEYEGLSPIHFDYSPVGEIAPRYEIDKQSTTLKWKRI